jgi:hypothetical protein
MNTSTTLQLHGNNDGVMHSMSVLHLLAVV